MKQILPSNLSSFVWHFLKPYKVSVFLYILLAALEGFWVPFNNILIKKIVDASSVADKENISLILWPSILIVVNFLVFDNLTARTSYYINYKFQGLIKKNIINKTLEFSFDKSQNFFQNNLSGKIVNNILTLADNIESMLHDKTRYLIRGSTILIFSFFNAYSVNSSFLHIFFVWFILFTFYSGFMSKKLMTLGDKQALDESILSGQLVDSVSNQSNIRIFSRKNHELLNILPFLNSVKTAFQNKQIFLVFFTSVQAILITIMLSFSVYFLAVLYKKNSITAGDFTLILASATSLGHTTWYTMSILDFFNLSIGRCRQSLSALMAAEEIVDLPNAQELKVPRGKITFENVSFGYKNTNSLFQEKNITIEAGEKIGLVGYSGGGKSSFINLILRLYDLDQGMILIDDQDISQVTQDSLRRNIGMIPQDPSLFHRSLLENIRYGRIDASDEEVINAAKKAFAHNFITALPESYQSLVGERGVKLSGGQRQRIAIARVILKNAPILILDEATSQLDSVTENDIQKSLWNLMQDKTTIIIAHRLSTLLQMQRILVFDQGKIVEDGTHDQLIEFGGLYKKLWQTQSGGFIKDVEIKKENL